MWPFQWKGGLKCNALASKRAAKWLRLRLLRLFKHLLDNSRPKITICQMPAEHTHTHECIQSSISESRTLEDLHIELIHLICRVYILYINVGRFTSEDTQTDTNVVFIWMWSDWERTRCSSIKWLEWIQFVKKIFREIKCRRSKGYKEETKQAVALATCNLATFITGDGFRTCQCLLHKKFCGSLSKPEENKTAFTFRQATWVVHVW